VYNVVDYASVSFPTGILVDKSLDSHAADYKSQSKFCQEAHDSCKLLLGQEHIAIQRLTIIR
jgi:hypothetical protein